MAYSYYTFSFWEDIASRWSLRQRTAKTPISQQVICLSSTTTHDFVNYMETNQKKPGNYFALDGGRTALPALHITEEMCTRLQYDLESDEEVRLCDHSDLLGGSGPGAVAAILLGRMGLKTSQAIDAYQKLEPALSVQPTKDNDERRKNTEAFKAAFTEALVDAGFTADTPMMDKTAPKTVVWTLSAANLSVPQPIRSYRVRSMPGPSCTILEAACASIASPDKFLPVTLGSGSKKITLVDATAGYANPTKELLKEAEAVFSEDAEVASIISLGAGKEDALNISGIGDADALADALRRTALDSERTHEEMHGRLNETSTYFRFNVERGLEQQIDASSIYERTTAYMKEGGINKLLDNTVKNIRVRPKGSTLKDINSVTAVEITLKPRPSLVRNFVGREDILDAMAQTHIKNRPHDPGLPAITVLMGLGGSGKTQTALRFALDYEEIYRDASVYFFNASSEAKLKADFELAIRARDSASRAKSHKDALAWFTNRKDDWFIMFDNADDPSLDLFRYIPKSSRGNVVITTRNLTHKKLAPNSSHHIEGLLPVDACTLILKGSSYPDTEENRAYAQLISQELGYLPLALAHAAAYISDHQCLPTYLDLYRERRAKFLATMPALPEDYNLSVATTIQMCLDSISTTACDVMALLSRLDATFIAHSIVAKAAERQFRHVNDRSKDEGLDPQTVEQADALMSIFCPSAKWSESDFNDIIEQCLHYSLLHVTARGKARFYSMHVLVQVYLQSISTTIRESQPEQLIVRLLGSSITVNFNYKYQAFNRLLAPHLRLIAAEHVVESGDYFGFGHVLREQGNARLAMEHYEWCLALRMSSLGDEHMSTANVMHELAVCYRDVGRYQEALDLEVKVLDLRKQVLGDEHPRTLVEMNNLAMLYTHLGRHQEALELQVKVLDLRKRISGDENPDTMMAMNNLATTYSHLGRYREALELQVKVLDLQKRVSGDEHPDTLVTMGNLAMFYIYLGKHQEALELQAKVLDLRKRVLGDEHPDTLHVMGNLALSYSHLGRYQEALELEVKVVDLRKRISGEEHPDTLAVMGNLAMSYSYLGRYQEALKLQVKVVDLRKRVSGDEHPDTLLAMGNLAFFYGHLGRDREALELQVKVLDLRKRVSGDSHPETLKTMSNLAASYSNLGRNQEALELKVKVLNLQKRISGDKHPDTLQAMENLAGSYYDLGMHRRALELQEKVWEMRTESLGEGHPDTLFSTNNLAFTLHALGMRERAIALMLAAVPLQERALGKDYPLTIQMKAALEYFLTTP